MKKILLSLIVMVMASAAIIGATQAYFTGTATLGVNTMQAGKVIVNVGDTAVHQVLMSPVGLIPGVWSDSFPFQVNNVGTIPVTYSLSANGVYESFPNFYALMYVKVLDINDNVVVPETLLSSFNYAQTTVLDANGTHNYKFQYALASTAGDEFQGQYAQFNLVVSAEQIH